MSKIRPKGSFSSIGRSPAPPKGPTVLTIKEVAKRLRVTERHVVGLIEQGQLQAIDLSGRERRVPLQISAFQKLSEWTGISAERLMEFSFSANHVGKQARRALWRVPLESLTAFMDKRSSSTPQ